MRRSNKRLQLTMRGEKAATQDGACLHRRRSGGRLVRMLTPHSADLRAVVSVAPDIMSGTPVFRGTRVPVKSLLDYLAAGDSLDEFLEQFPTV